MISAGLDGQMKIWDLRTYKCFQEYYTLLPASNLDTSQTGLLGVGYGSHVQVSSLP
jgi:U3 small nucleolar RNA-associated protein 7